MINMVKLPTNKSSLFLRVAKGHFATSHSHINYYIDVVTTQKARLSEAKAVAKELVAAYQHNTIVDTVLCLDGTQVIGTCLANELTKGRLCQHERPPDHLCHHPGVHHRQPDHPARQSGPHGQGQACAHPGRFHHHRLHRAGCDRGDQLLRRHWWPGLSAIFATATECMGIPVTSIFDPSNLPDYASFDSRECPMCKAGQHIDALVNSFGYSAL